MRKIFDPLDWLVPEKIVDRDFMQKVKSDPNDKTISELHAFVEAFDKAYATVIYAYMRQKVTQLLAKKGKFYQKQKNNIEIITVTCCLRYNK